MKRDLVDKILDLINGSTKEETFEFKIYTADELKNLEIGSQVLVKKAKGLTAYSGTVDKKGRANVFIKLDVEGLIEFGKERISSSSVLIGPIKQNYPYNKQI